ncbi:MAG: AmmeMemoRadiSam system protein B [Devosia sp.]
MAKAVWWRVLSLALALWTAPVWAEENGFLDAAGDAPRLLAAIEKERPAFTPPAGVTGISVPHHLLADDLIARGFWAASAMHPRRVLLISPDHFRKVKGAFATTREDLRTVFGIVPADDAGVDALLSHPELFEALPGIDHEHGVMALAPFVAHFFPDAQIVPVLASINADASDWSAAVAALKPLIDADTLVVQSTDYSHYLPQGEAVLRDQETLTMLAAGDADGVLPLMQPSHMDSKSAQFIQLRLQHDVFGAVPVVLANRNSAEYGPSENSSTSYVVTAWVKDPAAGAVFDYPDQHRVMFAGDTLAGRYLLPALRDKAAWAAITGAVSATTANTPLIVNLEGVVLDEPVAGLGIGEHLMLMEDTAPLLAAFRVRGTSLANNHANDLGDVGREESVRLLKSIGIAPIEHGAVTDFGGFRIVGINFVRGRLTGDRLASPDDLDWVCGLHAAPPLVAFVHWGTEYTDAPSDAERGVAEKLAGCGVSLVVGAHAHRASPVITPMAGGRGMMLYSLGNFLFDQSESRGSGELLELRVFRQGTIAARLVPLPNLFELGKKALEAAP